MTINQTPSPNSATPTRARATYALAGIGTTTLHLSARDLTDLGLTPNARTVHLFGATFTRIEKI